MRTKLLVERLEPKEIFNATDNDAPTSAREITLNFNPKNGSDSTDKSAPNTEDSLTETFSLSEELGAADKQLPRRRNVELKNSGVTGGHIA